MPIFKTKNENFFKKWNNEMAYVLGFFCADGNLTIGKRNNHYIEFTNCDKDILEKIRKTLGSNHKISKHKRKNKNWRTYYRLQIGSKEMFYDLTRLGMIVNKSKVLGCPNVPSKYLSHFVRGYFDGDGNVVCGYFRKSDRKSKSPVLSVRFTSGSKTFLTQLKDRLKKHLNLSGSIHYNAGWRLIYSTNDSRTLFRFIYTNADSLFLNRKRRVFMKDNQLGTVA
ncbi:MAG: hypothetical protein NTV77_02710 [Candidatus Azambacteria bacterium]|nr:hypothetical protein [Candidatus Azambacteria bacterium]